MTTECTNEIEIFPIHGHLIWKILLEKVMQEKLWMGNKLHNKRSEHSMRGFLSGHLHIRNTLLPGALVQNSWKGFTVSSKSFTSHSRPPPVCHLMTERGDSRVIMRPLWAASTPTGCVWSSCQRRHTDIFSSAVGVDGCSDAAIGRPDALFY